MARPRAPGSKRLPFSTPRNLAMCSVRSRKYSLLSIDTPTLGMSGSLSETVKVAANSNADVNNRATKSAPFGAEVPGSCFFTFDLSSQLHRCEDPIQAGIRECGIWVVCQINRQCESWSDSEDKDRQQRHSHSIASHRPLNALTASRPWKLQQALLEK